MPELAEVETPKKLTPLEEKIKREEEELQALMKARTEEIEEKAEEQEDKPRPPSGLSRAAAKKWLSDNGYGNVDKKEAFDYIKNLQEDWDRLNK